MNMSKLIKRVIIFFMPHMMTMVNMIPRYEQMSLMNIASNKYRVTLFASDAKRLCDETIVLIALSNWTLMYHINFVVVTLFFFL